MKFGKALKHLDKGEAVNRESWGNPFLFVEKIDALPLAEDVGPFLLYHGHGTKAVWTPSFDDMFAEDWRIVARE